MRALTLGLRTLAREWRSGELGVLLLALVVAVAALTGVGLLVDRVDRAMRLQASEVLGADLRLQSGNAIPAAYADAARQQGLATSRATAMLSVVLHGEASQLANLYAVAPGYPLRGTVRVTDAAFGAPAPTRHKSPPPTRCAGTSSPPAPRSPGRLRSPVCAGSGSAAGRGLRRPRSRSGT